MFADSLISIDNDTGAASLPLEAANAYSQAMDEVARTLAKAHGVDLPAITEETAITAEQAKNASSAF
jgi:hypothetical protein